MNSLQQPTDNRQPGPAICPICGQTATNGVMRRDAGKPTATYCDTEGHLFSVTWLEVTARAS